LQGWPAGQRVGRPTVLKFCSGNVVDLAVAVVIGTAFARW